jgi:hypothetical protein
MTASRLQLLHRIPRGKEDVRDATRAVEATIKPGECTPTVWQIVAHYQTAPAPLHYVYREPAGMMERQLQDLIVVPVVLVLRARPWVDDPDGSVLAAVESHYHAVEMNFPGVRVIYFSSGN